MDELMKQMKFLRARITQLALERKKNSMVNTPMTDSIPQKVRPLHPKVYPISGISLLPTSYKILSTILLSRLSPYIGEITGDHQCGFRHNRSTIDKIFCIC
jgi:hypothetical protein